jgi:hypothetical protein
VYHTVCLNDGKSSNFKKMHIEKVFIELKRRKYVENLVELNRKNKTAFNFLYAMKKQGIQDKKNHLDD